MGEGFQLPKKAANIPHSSYKLSQVVTPHIQISSSIIASTNRFHDWFLNQSWSKAERGLQSYPGEDSAIQMNDVRARLVERDDQGRTPLRVLAEFAQSFTFSTTLMDVATKVVYYYPEALIKKDNNNETPHDVALRSECHPRIQHLLATKPPDLKLWGFDQFRKIHSKEKADEEVILELIKKNDWGEIHDFYDVNDYKFVFDILSSKGPAGLYKLHWMAEYCGSAQTGQLQHCGDYNETLACLIFRTIARFPEVLTLKDDNGRTPFSACKSHASAKSYRDLFALSTEYVKNTPPSKILKRFFPTKYNNFYETYNTICMMMRRAKHSRIEMNSLESIINPKKRCVVCNNGAPLTCSRCKSTFYCSAKHQKNHWAKHKKICKPPKKESASEEQFGKMHLAVGVIVALMNLKIEAFHGILGSKKCSFSILNFVLSITRPRPLRRPGWRCYCYSPCLRCCGLVQDLQAQVVGLRVRAWYLDEAVRMTSKDDDG